ncbi:1-acyl-sn-glycerol-3-phosphate acyltransferase [Candidatus Termititenax persephonae]|uniref:1-acyl-sn-glycerol-3-phosphate acyltransferase n=1 Tax=Candidatus Termititenax persephonae TaxID=2218525 RepID=A0A388THY9_9BACT|nr:1-acyl-sn-glycerol-3-phosphate acyltransferase [Candidatus Termititenax persephonae]
MSGAAAGLFGYLRLALLWTAIILSMPIGILPLLFLAYFFPRHVRLIAVWWGRILLLVSGFRVTVKGAENIPAAPLIVASNHTSYFDIFIALGYLPLNFSFVMKEELFKIPIFGKAVRTLGYFPISRRHPRSAVRSMNELAQFLRGGGTIFIYPEGTRNTTPEPLLPFKSGMERLAKQAQVAILPVAVLGGKATQKLPWRTNSFTVIIGKPLPPAAENLTAATRQALERLLATEIPPS